MNTLANRRAMKAGISRGWSHDPGHYHFARQHRSTAPFPDQIDPRRSRKAEITDAVIGVVACVVLLLVAVFSGAAL